MTCTTTSCENEIDGTGWPATDGGKLCQECWEAECSESWWIECAAMQEFCEPTH